MFYGTGARPKKVLTKNIRQVRDLEDKILCPRAMASYAFFAITFFSDINFFLKFYSEKRRTKGLKLCEKKIGHHARLGENNLSLIWPTFLKGNLLGSGCARAHARADDARNYAQYVMRNAILRNHLKSYNNILPRNHFLHNRRAYENFAKLKLI